MCVFFSGNIFHPSAWKMMSKGMAKLGNIVVETMFCVLFPLVAKISGKQTECFAVPVAKRGKIAWENKWATCTYAYNDKLTSEEVYIFSSPGLKYAMQVNVNMVFVGKSCFVYDIVWTMKVKESERKAQIEIGWEEKRREGPMQVS